MTASHRPLSIYRHEDSLGSWVVASRAPSPVLAGFVDTLWTGEGRLRYQRDRILPSSGGYLLINLGPPQYLIRDTTGERIPFTDIWISGLQEGPLETEAPHGSAIVGVGLSACGARPWLGADASVIANATLPLAEVLGDAVLRLRDRLLDLRSPSDRLDCVERWLSARLDPRRAPCALTLATLRRLHATNGLLSIQQLCGDAGISRKHLAATFAREVGLSPKQLAGVLRFQHLLARLRESPRPAWSALATEAGYFDQAHFSRDFRRYTGFSPTAFERQQRPDARSVVVE